MTMCDECGAICDSDYGLRHMVWHENLNERLAKLEALIKGETE
jgi:hypothetical protein